MCLIIFLFEYIKYDGIEYIGNYFATFFIIKNASITVNSP